MQPGKKELVEGAVPTIFAPKKKSKLSFNFPPITSYCLAHFIVVQRLLLHFLVNFKFSNVTHTRIHG